MCLGLDQDIAVGYGHDRIPTPEVAGYGNGNLGPPFRAGRKALPEAVKECQVCSIPNRIPVRMERSSEFEADHRRTARDEIDGHRGRVAAFEPYECVWADANARCYLSDAETAHAPREIELVADPLPQQPTPPLPACERRVATGHADMVVARPYPPLRGRHWTAAADK